MELERRDGGSAKEDGETGEWVTGSPEARCPGAHGSWVKNENIQWEQMDQSTSPEE